MATAAASGDVMRAYRALTVFEVRGGPIDEQGRHEDESADSNHCRGGWRGARVGRGVLEWMSAANPKEWRRSRQSRLESRYFGLFARAHEQTGLVIKITKRPISTDRLSTTTRAINLGGGPFESTYPQVSEYASPRFYYKYFLELNLKY